MRFTLPFLFALASGPVMAEVPRVVTDIPPVHALVSLVMGDLGAPVLLLDRGASAHDFALRPSQAAALQAADLVVWVGPEMTPWLARGLEGIGVGAEPLRLLAVPGTHLRDFDEAGGHGHDDHGHDHDDHAHAGHDHKGHGHDHGDHGHDHKGHRHGHDDHDHDHDDHAHDGHDHGGHGHDHEDHAHDDHGHSHDGVDPHAWLDPHNGLVWLDRIAAALGARDPANATAYAANAEAAKARIAALDARLRADLAPVRGRSFVVTHDAYGYFTAHYGLSVAGSVSLGDASAPGAARLRALREGLVAGGAVCAFPEAEHDSRLLETVVEGTGVRVGAALDPEGRGMEPGPQLYEAVLEGLAQGLRDCLAE